MIPTKKSEWFKLESPIGEPEIKWTEKEYHIERIVKEDGTIIWFGQATNWVHKPNENWKKLETDYSVEPNKDGTYPEERKMFVNCKTPIYEVLYDKLIGESC